MAESQNEIWTLQLVRFFVSHGNYLQLNVSESRPHEIWLINPQNQNYILIHISRENDYDNPDLQKRMTTVLNTVARMAKTNGRLLDITLGSQPDTKENELIKNIVMYPNCPLEDSLIKAYPGIDTVVFDTDDPEKESSAIKESINTAQAAVYRKSMKFKTIIKQNTGLLFWLFFIPCVVICIAVNLTSYFGDVDKVAAAISWGAYYKAFVSVLNEWWRLLTSGFVHIDIFHIWCNMIALLSLSRYMRQYYTNGQAISIMLISIVVGNICVFIGDANTVAVGLSGGLYGWMMAIIVHFALNGYFKDPILRRQILSTIVINLIISFMPNVSLLSHLGGAIAGLFLGFVMDKASSKVIRNNFIITGVLLVMVLGYMTYSNRSFSPYYYGTDLQVADLTKKIGLKNYSNRVTIKMLDYYENH